MSTVKTNNLQVGQSVTATNNFTVYQPAIPDGTVRLGNGNAGSVTDLLTLTSSGNLGIGTSSITSINSVLTTQITGNIRLGNTNSTGAIGFGDFSSSIPNVGIWRGNTTQTFASGNYLKLGGYDGITFSTGNAALTSQTEQMRLDTSGNLGLGVTPSAWGSGWKASQIGDFGGAVSYSGGAVQLGLNTYNNGSNWLYTASSTATLYQQVSGTHKFFTAPSGTAGAAISFTQAMTLDASGNLGIGTSSPGYKLDVNSGNAGGIAARFVGALVWPGSGSTNPFVEGSSVTDTLRFGTASQERMRIDSSGNLLVGTTALPVLGNEKFGIFSSSGCFGFKTTGARVGAMWVNSGASATNGTLSEFYNGSTGTPVGSISCSATATSYITSSDYRLKENIQPMQNALGVVAQLNPVTYTWKADGSDGQGFIAHELQAVVPDCVTGEKDAVDEDGKPVYQGIDTSFLVATLTKAIQELTARVIELEKK